MSLTALSRNLSDHNPLLFTTDLRVDWGPKLFISLDSWWDNGPFASFLQLTWSNLPDMSIVAKLRCLRSRIKARNAKVIEDLHSRSTLITNELDAFEILSEPRQLSSAEVKRWQMLKVDNLNIQKQLQSLWA